jgi:hypothetical protein
MAALMRDAPANYLELAAGRALVANGAFMAAVGARIGDTVTLLTPAGPVGYRVVAVATDLLNVKITRGGKTDSVKFTLDIS